MIDDPTDPEVKAAALLLARGCLDYPDTPFTVWPTNPEHCASCRAATAVLELAARVDRAVWLVENDPGDEVVMVTAKLALIAYLRADSSLAVSTVWDGDQPQTTYLGMLALAQRRVLSWNDDEPTT